MSVLYHMSDKENSKSNKKSTVIGIVILLLALAAAFFAFTWMDGNMAPKPVAQASPDEATADTPSVAEEDIRADVVLDGREYAVTHDLETILLMGTDGSGNTEGTGEDYRGDLADFLLLMVIDKTDHSYGFLQIDRDTMTDVALVLHDGTANAMAYEQICTAHWYGPDAETGCENTVDAVSGLLGYLPIDAYYSIDMDQIGTLNHLVGGVEVTLEEDFSEKDPEMMVGSTLTLTDAQAEIFVRGRMDVADGTNVNRMKRQRQYMQGFLQKVKDRIQEEPDFINTLYDAMQDVSMNTVTGKQLSWVTEAVASYEHSGTLTLDGDYEIGATLDDGLEHQEFYPSSSSIRESLETLTGMTKMPE